MNKLQTSYLFVAAISFLAVFALLFFAATASKNALAFLALAVLFALNGVFWGYRFAKGRRAV